MCLEDCFMCVAVHVFFTLYIPTNRSYSLRLNWSECHVFIPELKVFSLILLILPHFFLIHFILWPHNRMCNKTQGIMKCIQSKNRTRFFFSPKINWFCNFDRFFFIHRQILINTLRMSKMIFDSHRGDRHDLFSITMIKLQKRQRRKGKHMNSK